MRGMTLLVASRAGLFLLAYLGLVLLPLTGAECRGMWSDFPDNRFLDGWARWDAGWYRGIAEAGYTGTTDIHGFSDTRFFPLYPLLMRWTRLLTGDTLLAGILLSNVLFVVAGMLLHRLVRERYDEGTANRSLILLCTYPFSYIFSAAYSESLFLVCAVGAFYLGHRRNWLAAALCASLAAATRVPGFLVGLGLLVLYLEQINFNPRHIRADVLALAVVPILPAIHLYSTWVKFGKPLTFMSTHVIHWSGAAGAAGSISARVSLEDVLYGRYPAGDLLHMTILAVALASCLLAFFRVDRAWAVWTLANLVVALNAWTSTGRYVTVLFPLYVAWARVASGRQVAVAAFLGTLGLSLMTLLFSHWSPVAR